MQVEYHRFARYFAPMSIEVRLGSGVGRAGKVQVWVSHPFLEKVPVQHIMPEPEHTEVEHDRLTYIFRVPDPSQPMAVTFHLQPEYIGPISAQVGLVEGPQLSFRTFVYP